MPFQWLSQPSATSCPERPGLGSRLAGLALIGCILFFAALSGAEELACDEACLAERRTVLAGDWYVLVHFEDPEATEDPGPQWDDQIWRIEVTGERLRWTIFPHVELKNAQGRYQETEDGLVARSLGAWWPDAEQWTEIRAGVKTDSYAARTKTLRVSGPGEWQSSGRLRSGSASMVGYHERWQIDFEEREPVFIRVDSMGSGRTDVLTGQTRYAVQARDSIQGEMKGLYTRGEQTQGRFTMVRMGERAGSGS